MVDLAKDLSKQALAGTCPICGSMDVDELVHMPQVPVYCNVLWPTRREALDAPRGDIRLGFCRGCGHTYNQAFDPGKMEYSQAYENSLHFSPRFQDYARSLAERLVERYDLYGKDIIEIGSGQGDFLTLLCELGDNRGVGFDPSFVPEDVAQPQSGQTRFVQDYYSESHAHHAADLICCRHVLEHIDDPAGFLATIRRAIGSRLDTVLFFEVPHVLFTLKDLGIWDIIYEHCSYFSPASLARLFTSCGFDILHLGEAFGGQFLQIEAHPAETSPGSTHDPVESLEEVAHYAASFSETYWNKIDSWRSELEQLAEAGQQAVVWGAGSKGVTFLNVLQAGDQIRYVVDINPRKQGMHIAGTGQQVIAQDRLAQELPSVVVVMNAIYKDEIREMTRNLGLDPGFRYA